MTSHNAVLKSESKSKLIQVSTSTQTQHIWSYRWTRICQKWPSPASGVRYHTVPVIGSDGYGQMWPRCRRRPGDGYRTYGTVYTCCTGTVLSPTQNTFIRLVEWGDHLASFEIRANFTVAFLCCTSFYVSIWILVYLRLLVSLHKSSSSVATI